MVWNTRSAGVWQRTSQTLNNVTLLITSCEFMPWSAKILEGFYHGWEDPNLTCPENEVCLMLVTSALLIPPAVRVWCSECGRCSLLLTHRQQAQKAGLPSDCRHTEATFPLCLPLWLPEWIDRALVPGYSPFGFHQWVEFLWDSLELAFLLSSFYWNEPGFESAQNSGFRTPQFYL